MTLGAFPETFPDHPQGPMNDDLPGTQTCCASAPAGRAPHLRKSRAVVPARGGAPPTSVNGRLATGLYGGSQRLQSHSSEQEMAPGLGSGVCPHPRPLGLSPCCSGLGVRSGPQLDWSPRQRQGCYLCSCLQMCKHKSRVLQQLPQTTQSEDVSPRKALRAKAAGCALFFLCFHPSLL